MTAEIPPPTEITVNGEVLSEIALRQERHALAERYAEQFPDTPSDTYDEKLDSDAVDNAVEHLLLVQEARKRYGAPEEVEIEKRLKKMLKQAGLEKGNLPAEALSDIRKEVADGILYDRLIAELSAEISVPGDEEVEAWYHAHPEEFAQPEMIHASHIIQQPQEGLDSAGVFSQLLNLRQRLLAGEALAPLANEFSVDDTDGGDLGFFGRGQMVPEFDEEVFKLQPGEVSDVIRTRFGLHLVQIHDRLPASTLPLEQVRRSLAQSLHGRRCNDAIGGYVDTLLKFAEIQRPEPEASG